MTKLIRIIYTIVGILLGIALTVVILKKFDRGIIPPADNKDALMHWLDDLARHEGCAFKVVNGELVGTWDNGSYSYGPLCFKRGTLIGFVKGLKILPEAEDDEIMNLAGDAQFTKQVAYKMITTRYENWRHWYNTVKNHVGLPPKI